MRYRRFGTTDLTVSEIGFGCARLGGIFQGLTRAEMIRSLQLGFEQGITFYDTADMYCQGESEQLLGEAFRHTRAKVIIASKAGYCLPARRHLVASIKPFLKPLIQRMGLKRQHLPSSVRGTLSQDFSSDYLIKAVEQSLRRLKTDYLDLYQLHSPPNSVLESGAFLEPLEKLKRQGKIRYYGVSCETTADALTCLRYDGISSLQIRYNVVDQSAQAEAIPLAQQKGLALIARECFAGGLLAKPLNLPELETAIPDEARRAQLQQTIMAYQRSHAGAEQPLRRLALQFVLNTPGITLSLLGMRTEAHLAANMQLLATLEGQSPEPITLS